MDIPLYLRKNGDGLSIQWSVSIFLTRLSSGSLLLLNYTPVVAISQYYRACYILSRRRPLYQRAGAGQNSQKGFIDRDGAFCYNTICAGHGGVSEWFMELVLKTSDPARDRGFESHPLRHAYLAAGSLWQRSLRSGTQVAEEDGLLNR